MQKTEGDRPSDFRKSPPEDRPPQRRDAPPKARRGRSKLVRLLRETQAIAGRMLLELVRRRRSLIFWSLFPAAVLALNAAIVQERAQLDWAEAFERAAPPTLVGAALFFSGLGGSVAAVVAERENRTLKRLFLSPLNGLSYFLGVFLAQAAIGLGQTFWVYAIAGAFGGRFQGNPLLGLAIVLLSVAAYAGTGVVLGTQLARRTEDANALVAAFGVPLLILGGAFLPTSLFPDRLLELAQFNPVFHMAEALSAVGAEGEGVAAIAPHLRFLAIYAAGATVAGWLAYRRTVRVERRL